MTRLMLLVLVLGGLLVQALPVYAADVVELTTRVSGMVESVQVKPGQSVKKGAVLLKLDAVVMQARQDEAEAEFMSAEADERDARREFERAQTLYERTVSSASELEAATLRHTRARAALAAARARLTIARKDRRDTELRAPFDGVVKSVAAVGTVVAADCQPRTLVTLRAGR